MVAPGPLSLRRAVFLDRDGVLNQAVVKEGKPYPPKDAEDLVIAPETEGLLKALKKEGFLLICVTNQPDVARGTRTLENVTLMNRKVKESLPLDELLVCLHDNKDKCPCRKPKPGLLLSAASKWGIDLSASYMVGDRASDVGAGRAAGTRAIFIDYGYAEAFPEPPPDFVVGSLKEAVALILGKKQ